MTIRVGLIVFFGVVCRWCGVFESGVLSTKRPTVATSLATLGALDPHGRGTNKQRAFPTGGFTVAGDRGMDADLPRELTWSGGSIPKKFGARLYIDEPVPLARHGK
eukprot:CAMPEP_0172625458 /NCGR_PEP_ID=MMETSP1068-20121228/144016_1 /TAXON_ID=35684 /ORGANISM="Pseudopedinella elastica, Strain CCMP716" /LENGTH=105 /DNA_ID=CAMNT_0013434761 /DNA_START=70 /DNA_END=385 /DNA_ORIENTATION=+